MFFSLPNLTAKSVVPMAHPELYTYAGGKLPFEGDKVAYNKWCSELSTQHSFLSMFEGLSPGMRVSWEHNPPVRMHGVHVDYDYDMDDDIMALIERDPPSEFKPTWVSKSRNGRCRLTWDFDVPGNIMNAKHWTNLKRRLNAELALFKWHRKMDAPAFADAARYFEHGTDWRRTSVGKPIPQGIVSPWFFQEALNCSSGLKEYNYEIPIEDVAAEVHRRFPGRWVGDFKLGALGVRFWDPSADAAKGAWVRKDGMYCFTGESRFLPWVEIFGKEFMSQYSMKAMDDLLETYAYDGRQFWSPNSEGDWMSHKKDDVTQTLRVMGFRSSRKEGLASEIDKVEHTLKIERRVIGALPFLYKPSGRLKYKGEWFINVCRTAISQPGAPLVADGHPEWADGATFFPFIHKLITNLFVPGPDDDRKQLYSFLAWLKTFYTSAYFQKPCQGHAVFIAGPTGVGKSLLLKQVLDPLFGGCEDAIQHLAHGDIYTERLARSPIMAVDDSQGISDLKTHARFSAMMKKYVADPHIVCNEKYKSAGTVPWPGRLIVLCNVDAESLRILPNMNISMRDKVCLFRTSSNRIPFSSEEENNQRCANDLPNFARFLLDWVIPVDMTGEGVRFGFHVYHHPDLLVESQQQGHSTIIEILLSYLDEYKKRFPDRLRWVGTAATLHGELSTHNPGIMREINCKALGNHLANLGAQGFGVRGRMLRTSVREWTLEYDLQKKGESDL